MGAYQKKVLYGLFLTGMLCACSPSAASPSGSGTPVLETWTSAAPNPSSFNPSYTPETNLTPQENPDAVPSVEANPEQESPPVPESTEEITSDSTASPSSGQTRPPQGNPPFCNDAIFVEDVTIPDGTVLKPGEEFNKTWRLKNTGTCTWTTKYALGFAYGERMHGSDTKLPKSVAPGQTVDITVKLTAPMDRCWYGSWWRLRNEQAVYFGDFVFVSVSIVDETNPNTPDPSICPGYVPPSP